MSQTFLERIPACRKHSPFRPKFMSSSARFISTSMYLSSHARVCGCLWSVAGRVQQAERTMRSHTRLLCCAPIHCNKSERAPLSSARHLYIRVSKMRNAPRLAQALPLCLLSACTERFPSRRAVLMCAALLNVIAASERMTLFCVSARRLQFRRDLCTDTGAKMSPVHPWLVNWQIERSGKKWPWNILHGRSQMRRSVQFYFYIYIYPWKMLHQNKNKRFKGAVKIDKLKSRKKMW